MQQKLLSISQPRYVALEGSQHFVLVKLGQNFQQSAKLLRSNLIVLTSMYHIGNLFVCLTELLEEDVNVETPFSVQECNLCERKKMLINYPLFYPFVLSQLTSLSFFVFLSSLGESFPMILDGPCIIC